MTHEERNNVNCLLLNWTNPVNKIDKLPTDAVKAAVELNKTYGGMVRKISDRMDYIVRFCGEVSGCKIDWWDWDNGDADSHADGDFIKSYNEDYLQINCRFENSGNKMMFIDKNGDELNLQWGKEFPTRWLFEDFEEEYINGLKLYEEKKWQKAQRDKENRLKREQEKKAAVAKLTKADRKILGIE